ncbi:MAG: hypothetical protein RL552_285 [Actinomycetota bacterium]
MPWHSAARASSTVDATRHLPASSPRMNTPNPSTVSAREIENENSPAIVDAMLPP